MDQPRSWRHTLFIDRIIVSDLTVLIALALVKLLVHLLTNGAYGFYRDELATIDDARYLAWGYVAYPPLAPFVARIAFGLFGPSVDGLRLFPALAGCIAMVLAGLIAKELGGSRPAQMIAALATAISPTVLNHGSLFEYVSFDYLWWVLIAYLTVRLLKSENPRWWLGIGAVIGLGMMTRYTMLMLVVGIVAATLLTRTRRDLRSPWMWGGIALSLLIFVPNLIWQIQHDFIALEFAGSIHARDIEWGRTEDFLIEQLYGSANPITVPLWIAGLYFYFFSPDAKRTRMLGWMAVVPFALFLATQSRGYYTIPIYPSLLAAGAAAMDRWVASLAAGTARLLRGVAIGSLVIGGLVVAPIVLPLAPVNSDWWNFAIELNETMVEKIGWPELAETTAEVYEGLPEAEQARTAILAANYGEAGAINLYGPSYGLPEAISGINSYWYRGYGDPPPDTVIVLGYREEFVRQYFRTCEAAGWITNDYGVENEETTGSRIIWVCRDPKMAWPDLWAELRHFG